MAESADLAAFLKERREAAGMTQQALASEARVSVSWLAKMEQGAIVEPGFFPVFAVLRALGVHLPSFGPRR